MHHTSMFSLLTSEIKATNRFSTLDSAIKGVKEQIKGMESSRITAVLNNLKCDEVRLKKCIDDIEVFHRDMFVLLKKEDKPADTENALAIKDDINKTEYSVTEPECSGNEPMHLVNEPECSGNEPMYWVNEPECSGNELMHLVNEPECSRNEPMHLVNEPEFQIIVPYFLINEPDSSQNSTCQMSIVKIGNRYSYKNESDDSNGSSFGKNESGDSKNETGDGIIESGDDANEPGDGKNESSFDMDESNYEMEESGDGKEESSDSKDKSSDSKDESDDSKSESSDNENEMAKKVLLNLVANKEKQITELLLHLIKKFSRFQRKLQKAEMSIFQSTKTFPSESNVKVKKKLEALSEYVLYLDKTVSNIYVKYSKVLG